MNKILNVSKKYKIVLIAILSNINLFDVLLNICIPNELQDICDFFVLGLNVFIYLRTSNLFRQTNDLDGEKSDRYPPAEVMIWAVSNKS